MGEEEQGCPYSSKAYEKDNKAVRDNNFKLKKDLITANSTIQQLNDRRSGTRPRGDDRHTAMTRSEEKDFKKKKAMCCPDFNSSRGC